MDTIKRVPTLLWVLMAVSFTVIAAQANAAVLVEEGYEVTSQAYVNEAVVDYQQMVVVGDFGDAARINPYGVESILWAGHSNLMEDAHNNAIVQTVAITEGYLSEVSVVVDYRNLQAYGGTFAVHVGETDLNTGELLWSQRQFYIWQKNWHNATPVGDSWYRISIPSEKLLANIKDKPGVNTIIVSMSDILESGKTQYLNNLTISGTVNDAISIPKTITIEKEGWYTADLDGDFGMASYSINGGEFVVWEAGITTMGYLYTGDILELRYNSVTADEIEQLDNQSWYLYFLDGAVSIYVEDPPIPECDCTAAATLAYEEGVASRDTEVALLAARIAELENALAVALADDGNNGHGNDVGRVDSSNPGKKK